MTCPPTVAGADPVFRCAHNGPRRRPATVLVMLAACSVALAGCSPGRVHPLPAPSVVTASAPQHSAGLRPTRVATRRPTPVAVPPPATSAPAAPRLAGALIVLDPGHNPGNSSYPDEVNRMVNAVTEWKPCDTSGTATDSGYPEADFTYDVALRAAALLEADGARVVLTRTAATPWGPCITERAAIANRLHAAVALSIHADGGPASGYGFHVITPADVGVNHSIIAASARLGLVLHRVFHAETGEPFATYIGDGSGLVQRSDLGGLNLSLVPKVFIECGNMRNAWDAGRLESPGYRETVAAAIADALAAYLRGAST